MTDDTYYDEKPEIEPPLPDNMLDRLRELQARDEARGLTNLEQAILLSDIRQFNNAMKPLAETMIETMGEVAKQMNDALTPLVEAVDENPREPVGECAECGITIYDDEWHDKYGRYDVNRECLPCAEPRIDVDTLSDDQRQDYKNQEERYDQE